MPSARSFAATCGDYNSDDSEVINGTRFQANVAGQANVAAKRSHSPVLGNVKPVELVGPDAASDLGYSSHTAATMSSADSARSQKSSSAPAPSLKRRPTALVDHRGISSPSSPRKPPAKSGSVSRRSREREEPECTVPNCQCGKSQNRRQPALSPLGSGLELNFPPFDQRSDRPPYTPPNTRRPTSTYIGQPLISYDQQAQQNSLVSAHAAPSARYNDEPTQSTFDSSSSSEFDDDDDYDDDTDRVLMPPRPKPVPERRPSIRYANITNSYNTRMTQSQTLPERNRERDYEPRFARSAGPTINNSRTSSIRRPFINGAVKADSYFNSNGNPKVTVENAISRRRQLYIGHEQRIELEVKHRDLEAYKDTAQPQPRRRQTDLDPRRCDAGILKAKKREVEAYQQRSRGGGTGPQLTESALKAAKRSSRIISGGSDIGSISSKASSNNRSSHQTDLDARRHGRRLIPQAEVEDTMHLRERSGTINLPTIIAELDVQTNEAHILSGFNPTSNFCQESVVEDSALDDNSPVFSTADTTFSDRGASLSTQSSAEELITAADELVALLQSDKELKPLYTIAFTKQGVGAKNFAENFQQLLRRYARDLEAEAKEPLHYMAARLTYDRAGYIANAITKQYHHDYKDMSESLPSANRQKDQERLDRYLSKLEPYDYHKALKAGSNDENDALFFDEDEWDNDSAPLQTLEQVRAFMISGASIKNLRRRFKQFVSGSSGRSLELEQKERCRIDSPSPEREQVVISSGEVAGKYGSQIKVSEKDRRGQNSQPFIDELEDESVIANTELKDTTATSPDVDPSCGPDHPSRVVHTSTIIPKPPESNKSAKMASLLQSPKSVTGNVVNKREGFRNSIANILGTKNFGIQEIFAGPLRRHINRKLARKVDIFNKSLSIAFFTETLPERLLRQAQTVSEVLRICEKRMEPGVQRLRWTCSCGKSLYDDFIELQPGALEELRARLGSERAFKRSDNGDNASAPGRLIRSGWFLSRMGLSSPSRQRNNRTNTNSGCLPTYSPQSGTAISATNPSAPTVELLYLLLCINNSNFGADLHHERIQHISCDRALFHYLHEIYAQRRSTLRSAVSLRTVRSINLVKFAADMSAKVNIYPHSIYCDKTSCTCMPPESIVEPAPNSEYRCKPIPAPHVPPIGENYMMHLYSSPGCINPSQLWVYNQFPKRTRGPLTAWPEAPTEGWGVHFREGWNWPKIWTVILTFFVGASFIFGVLYTVLKRDAQSAFGIAGYWITASTVLLGYLTTRNV